MDSAYLKATTSSISAPCELSSITGASHTRTYYSLVTALLTFISFLSRKYFYLSTFSSKTDSMQTSVHLFPALTTDDSVSCKLILWSTSCLTMSLSLLVWWTKRGWWLLLGAAPSPPRTPLLYLQHMPVLSSRFYRCSPPCSPPLYHASLPLQTSSRKPEVLPLLPRLSWVL